MDINVLGADNTHKSILVAEGGWPLTIELSTDDALGVTVFNGTTAFPDLPLPLDQIDSITSRAIGFLLFSNPDGVDPSGNPDPGYCLAFPSLYYFSGDPIPPADSILYNLNNHCTSLGPVEEHLYFAIGSDVGAAEIGNTYNPEADPFPVTGPSPRMPGLVILSDSGIGNLYENDTGTSYGLTNPREARNLAAYINSVGLTLRDSSRKTVLTASWIAPRNVITPYIERDSNIYGSCDGGDNGTPETWLRINGSDQLQTVTMNPNSPLNDVLREFEIKLRIFVVNLDEGHGPLVTLPDSNGDGQVDSKDAEAAGYTLLSEEKTVSLRISYAEFFGKYVDLDGNGCIGPAAAPAGTGGLSRIPR